MKWFIFILIILLGRTITKLGLHFMESNGVTSDLIFFSEIILTLMLLAVAFICMSRAGVKS